MIQSSPSHSCGIDGNRSLIANIRYGVSCIQGPVREERNLSPHVNARLSFTFTVRWAGFYAYVLRLEAGGTTQVSWAVRKRAAVLCDLEVVELIEMHCTLVIPLATPITLHSLLIFVVNCRTISF